MHSCVIFDTNGTPRAYGYNDFNIRSPTTEHAEAMAMRKLCINMKVKGIRAGIVVNILVVRTNGGNSKPCENCIRRMQSYSNYFTIRKIYYTNTSDTDTDIYIEKISFNSLCNDPHKHESSFYRNQKNGKWGRRMNYSSDDILCSSDSDDEIHNKKNHTKTKKFL
jgi:cytidine deaminase